MSEEKKIDLDAIRKRDVETEPCWYACDSVPGHALRDRRALLQEIARLEAIAYIPGVFTCGKCQCTITSTLLFVHSGRSEPNNKPAQECPNGCGPMRRATEREGAEQLLKSLIEARKL